MRSRGNDNRHSSGGIVPPVSIPAPPQQTVMVVESKSSEGGGTVEVRELVRAYKLDFHAPVTIGRHPEDEFLGVVVDTVDRRPYAFYRRKVD